MPDHGQVVLIRIGLDVLNFPNNAVDIRHAGAPAAGGVPAFALAKSIAHEAERSLHDRSKKVFL